MGRAFELSEEAKRELVLTAEDRAELEKARSMPITFDEDCPETTPERALKFKRVNPVRRPAN
jgi:hypothetical protein